MWWMMPESTEEMDEDGTPKLPWIPCPDCGAPMRDDDKTSWPYCPICLDEEDYPW